MTDDGNLREFSDELDDLLDTLKHPLRRNIIFYFETHAELTTVSLDELVAYLADQMSAYTRNRLALVLPHTHLPKLESRGWLKCDRNSNQITYHGHPEAARLLDKTYEVFTS